MLTNLYRLFQKWFPGRVDPAEWQDRLAQFYATNEAYHAMTATSGKEAHPQVQLLLSMVKKGGCYAEVGCGGGTVVRLLGRQAMVHGFDVSPIAIAKAKAATTTEQAVFECVEGAQLPLANATVDGCYSFEVLEHIWDPVAVIGEMVRVTKPGGFILISMPNHFSLDLHLAKKRTVRGVEMFLAGCRCLVGKWSKASYWNIKPQLEGGVFPDCDMVTTLNPCKIKSLFSCFGCQVFFLDSTYMCAHRCDSRTTLRFQRYTCHPFFKNLGDHWLILAKKQDVVCQREPFDD